MARTKQSTTTKVAKPETTTESKTESKTEESHETSTTKSTKKAVKASVKTTEPKVVEPKTVETGSVERPVEQPAKPKTVRNPRKKVTQDAFLEKLRETINILDVEIESHKKDRTKGTRALRKVRKNLKTLEKDAPKLSNKRGTSEAGGNKVSGFVLNCEISDELREFIGLKAGENPTRTDITNAVCAYIRLKDGEVRPQILKWKQLNPEGKRNLQDPNDKMAILPDAKLSKLLRYEQYKKDVAAGKVTKEQKKKGTNEKEEVIVDDDSLRYWVVQRLLQSHIKKGNKV